MLRAHRKEKERLKIAIPDELRDAIREAYFLIGESIRDPDVRLDYGDAIQCGCLIGGRVGSKKRPFEFTYYPATDRSSKSRCHLSLHPLEIEDIVDGCMTELILYCCRSPECGHRSTDPDRRCSCEYVEDPYSGNIKLTDADEALRRIGLPEITQDASRDEIVQQLGEPQETGGGEKHATFGYIWPWIKYHRVDYQLRFQFQKSGRLRGISILDPNWKPGT